MIMPTSRRIAAVVAVAGLTLAGCSSSNNDAAADGPAPGAGKAECAALAQYGNLSGKSVSVYAPIVAPEDGTQKDSYKLFENCTGAKINYEGSQEFEAQLQVRAQAGNLPDIAYVPQPGLLQTLVQGGYVKEAPAATTANVDKFFSADWKSYGTVDGKFYAAPLGASVKSFVWYSPAEFAAKGWAIPKTWDEMVALSNTIAAGGEKPWCAGIESGESTGWPLTDWLEDAVLRDSGPDVYNQWVSHKIKFNDPQIAQALDRVGAILKDPKYVNGGVGDVKSIATTSFQDGGLPILKNECAMHRQASFYGSQWGDKADGTPVKIGPNGDVFAFYLPTTNDRFGQPVLGGGEFVTAFSDRPEVAAFQTYLSSDVWANEKAKATPEGGWVSANKGLDVANLANPIDKLSAETLQSPNAVFRFDGSDQMPSSVGAGTFWTEMTNWISGESTADALQKIEASWPS